jgi:hypothetical protein
VIRDEAEENMDMRLDDGDALKAELTRSERACFFSYIVRPKSSGWRVLTCTGSELGNGKDNSASASASHPANVL